MLHDLCTSYSLHKITTCGTYTYYKSIDKLIALHVNHCNFVCIFYFINYQINISEVKT